MLRNYRGLFRGAMEISGVQPHSSGIPVLWMGLISALQKLEHYGKQIPMNNPNPAQNNLFIIEPLCGNSLLSMFATHPPTEARVRALMKMR